MVDVYANITKVADWSLTPNPNGIDPYARRIPAGEDVFCPGAAGSALCGVAGHELCWNQNPVLLPCTGNSLQPAGASLPNCYRKTGNKISLCDPCTRDWGWKGVAAFAPWPGRFGFVNSGSDCCVAATAADVTAGRALRVGQILSGGLEQTKFLSLTIHDRQDFRCKYTVTHSAGTGADYTSSGNKYFDQTAQTDVLGNVRRTGGISCRSTFTRLPTATSPADFDVMAWNRTGADALPILAPYFIFVPNGDRHFFSGGLHGTWFASPTTGVENIKCNSWTPPSYGGDLVNFEAVGVDGSNGFFAGEIGWQKESRNMSMTVSDTIIFINKTYSIEAYYKSDEGDGVHFTTEYCKFEQSQTVTIALGNPYSATQVQAVAAGLLANYPMGDDAVYPWRRDGKHWLLPLVTQAATPGYPTINWQTKGEANTGKISTDPGFIPGDPQSFIDSLGYTGETYGVPNPPGFARHYDFRHRNTHGYTSNIGNCGICADDAGATSPAEIPPTATQWTDWTFGDYSYGAGGHVIMLSSGCYAQKWAETMEAWPRQNAARPCGHDRALLDQDTVSCVASVIGTTVNLVAPATLPPATGSICALASGIYYVTRVSDTQYTLTTKIWELPTWLLIEANTFGRLRFPAYYGICGTLSVLAATDNGDGTVTVTFDRDAYLFGKFLTGADGEPLTFSGVPGLTTCAVVAAIPANNLRTFKVAGTLTGTYTGGGTVSAAGNAHPEHDTTCPEHKVLAVAAGANFRAASDGVQRSYLTSLQWLTLLPHAGKPTVLCVSPNSESFPYGFRYSFPPVTADQCVGNAYHLWFIQSVQDPLWQPSHAAGTGAVGSGGETIVPTCVSPWAKDTAWCSNDKQYRFPPYVEPPATFVDTGWPNPWPANAGSCSAAPNPPSWIVGDPFDQAKCAWTKKYLNWNCP